MAGEDDADPRQARWIKRDKKPDQRGRFQRDRDRVLYSSAFRRLGGVTQVVWAQEEGHLFHNRLTHSLKVAQVARRIAEWLQEQCETDSDVASAIDVAGGVDADVAETAGLAHDLGHPPFGHIGEEELDRELRRCGVIDGFEGNAQSFRIAVALARVTDDFDGFNLTSASLNSILKYPWGWTKGARKWGHYNAEREVFEWARTQSGLPSGQKSLEAAVMDWADDITYAVHDVEDFYRAGLIPLEELPDWSATERRTLFSRVEKEWLKDNPGAPINEVELKAGAEATLELPWANRRFRGTAEERARVRLALGETIGRYVAGFRLIDGVFSAPRALKIEVAILKELTRMLVIEGPHLGTQQQGQRRVVRDLFRILWRCAQAGNVTVFPEGSRPTAQRLIDEGAPVPETPRFIADLIAMMTEVQATRLHRRFTGVDFGTLMDAAVR